MSRALALASLMLFAGCGAAPEQDDVAKSSAPIAAGVVAPQVSGVVGVYDLDLHTLCSGVLVTDRVVVTARHCIAPAAPEDGTIDCAQTKFGSESAANRVVVTTGHDTAQPTDKHAVARVIVPTDASFCNGDVAVLVLAQPLATDVATPMPLRLDDEVVPTEAFSAIGIGRTESDPSGTRRRRDGLHVQCVGDACANSMVGSREWWGDGAVCEGDSGGPAVDTNGNVVGIASRKRSGCTATIYADVAGNGDFFRDALGLAKKTPTQPDVVKCSATPGKKASPSWLLVLAGALLLRRRR